MTRESAFQFTNGAEVLFVKMGCPVPGLKRQTGLWRVSSLINHSCLPNVARIYFGNLCFVQALRDIESGEELFTCFTHRVFEDPDVLEKEWGFTCQCEFCRRGGAGPPTNSGICKWKQVHEEKVLPKLASGLSGAALDKHIDYATKLLEKLGSLMDDWVAEEGILGTEVAHRLFRVHFVEPFYAFINALESRSEVRANILGLALREKRVMIDSLSQVGLLTLLSKLYMTLLDDHEKAKVLLPVETDIIRKESFPMELLATTQISSTMKSLLYLLDFPSSELVSYVHQHDTWNGEGPPDEHDGASADVDHASDLQATPTVLELLDAFYPASRAEDDQGMSES
mmetsp:Transcript_637/g.1928  ORF Transcript_637/g.1928 Transcript_637/m.1928 type:complete len:341 (+) Transcript_637:1-1023(+)